MITRHPVRSLLAATTALLLGAALPSAHAQNTASAADAPAVSADAPAFAAPVAPAPETASAPATSAPAASWSSSLDTAVTPSALPQAPATPPPAAPAPTSAIRHVRPFSAIGVQVKAGFSGIGADIAVPLAQRINLRVGGAVFQYSGSYVIDGITINGEAKFRTLNAAIDFFPFNNSFRISPGYTVYNGNNLNAAAGVAGGQNFDLDDVTYTSELNDPVHGSASMTFGNRKAPSLTMGWGNMIPRKANTHLSVPFEFGFQYIDDPKIGLNLAGTVCSNGGTVSGCGQLESDPIAQYNLAKEEDTLNTDIHPLRFYPILSIGVAWSFNFGHR